MVKIDKSLCLGLFLGFLILPGSARAALSVYVGPEELAARAPLVVEATVLQSRTGYDPEAGTLATYVTLDVERVHRGPADLERVVLREPGGRFGDWVHHVDAVPRYVVGERVFAFLEPAADGSLRTAGMFFGKFELPARTRKQTLALRRLGGAGLIGVRTTAETVESIRYRDLVSLAVTAGPRAPRHKRSAAPAAGEPGWRASPPEFSRLRFDGEGAPPPRATRLARRDAPAPASGRFVTLNSSNPARWNLSDSGSPLVVNIEPDNNPLGDANAAVAEMQRAMAAWTDVPEARLQVVAGDTDYDYTGTYAQSPAASYSGVHAILFDDPYDDISDPSGCSGVLAIGGYWSYSSPLTNVNGVDFRPAAQAYVIFNNNFACFLGNADNLAEVATHELGHAIGIGHSPVFDAIMRSSAYGGRGPRLGDDDMDAAHCIYPHTLDVLYPDGGETLTAGEVENVQWSVSAEAGPDPGTVDVEYSLDDGQSWLVASSGEPNDGSYLWSVPASVSTEVRMRVRRGNRVSPTPAPFPGDCSLDVSAATFTIEAAAPPLAGGVPAASPGGGVRLAKATGGNLTLDWDASCSGEATGYAVYEGTLAALRGGGYDHLPLTCAAGTDLVETISPGAGDRYFLISPVAGSLEGTLGTDGSGTLRPESGTPCAPRESVSTCP